MTRRDDRQMGLPMADAPVAKPEPVCAPRVRRDYQGYVWAMGGVLARHMDQLERVWETTKTGIRDDYVPADGDLTRFAVALRLHRHGAQIPWTPL